MAPPIALTAIACAEGTCAGEDGYTCNVDQPTCQKLVGTCKLFHCKKKHGATDCVDGECLCAGDTCSADGFTCSSAFRGRNKGALHRSNYRTSRVPGEAHEHAVGGPEKQLCQRQDIFGFLRCHVPLWLHDGNRPCVGSEAQATSHRGSNAFPCTVRGNPQATAQPGVSSAT